MSSSIDTAFTHTSNSKINGGILLVGEEGHRTCIGRSIRTFFEQIKTSHILTLPTCRSLLQSLVGLSLGQFPFPQSLGSDTKRRRYSDISLHGVTYLGEVPPFVAKVALGADVLTSRRQMARATSVLYCLLTQRPLVCRTDA